jgi:colanic acid biosynthesis glycosyl transferase WcaI
MERKAGFEPKPTLTILYHFFHPDDVVSARLYADLAAGLAARGWDVTVLTSDRYWRSTKDRIVPLEETWRGIRIVRLRRWGWNQAHDLLRIANSAWMMARWMLRLLSRPGTDIVLLGTDPQFSWLMLPLVKRFRRPRVLAHWCFDLFPEAILADEVSRLVRKMAAALIPAAGRAYRAADLIVDLGPCMRRRLDVYRPAAHRATLTPWSLVEPVEILSPDPRLRAELFGEARLTLLYSGNLGRAHDFELFLRLARRLRGQEPGIVFCFACRGNRLSELKAALTGEDTNIRLADFANEAGLGDRLNAADIHLASLRAPWRGIVVPSKIFGSMAAGKPVLYAGPEDSAAAGWINTFDLGLVLTAANLDSTAATLGGLAADPSRLATWGRNARQTYRERFAREIMIDGWDAQLRGELAEASSRRGRR